MALYELVSSKITEFCDNTYYDDIVINFKQSYDGLEWEDNTEFVYFENGTDVVFLNDWNEGQTFIKDLMIWHLNELVYIAKYGEYKICIISE